MKCLLVLLFMKTICESTSNAAEVLRPRGVSLSLASLYDASKEFHCLDGSGMVPFKYVNDDYCDCQDGSDEPGTSACPNGSFHCTNAGHIPLNIPSSRVNDGVCDCCDASDEYNSNSGCVNTCRELGRAAREEARRAQEEQARGYQLKVNMIQEGVNIIKNKKSKIEELRSSLAEAEGERGEKEAVKNEAEEKEKAALEKYRVIMEEKDAAKRAEEQAKEEQEAREAFAHLDSDADGILVVDELISRSMFDTNRDGQVTPEEAKFYLREEESVNLETFISTTWKMMRPVYMMDHRSFIPPTMTPPAEEEIPTPPEEEPMDEGDDDDDYSMGDGDEEVEATETDEIKYDDETQQLVDAAEAARSTFTESDKRVRDITREIKHIEDTLNIDFGPEEEFRILEGRCFEYTDREYTYKLCPFDKAVQKPRSGHGETRLGQWGLWTGEEDKKYSSMKYTDGQGCWNGPNRSAEVRLLCGVENKLVAVSEPNRCEYQFVFQTPAVCFKPEPLSEEEIEHTHTEL
ncbi:glucosidase 2 subunit beta isoform X2 [Oratosquilla oratoria]|uniref:glucosidase 2 subunit beta isoform X2 n=1 Tax=Oratosquilla oratoria TaxID=337810 RepID=UPI003F76B556